ncbi:unnamed protein product [Hydatigera taeniaeformis]|uniref:Uncharacterized protein n=1 Tax=Hydatigena taeniaeformis TaxID=6205 RepID=A0A0R3X3W4_HYDTA|nr:unnamed protein product [Hydatigera taeniaeformis]
MLTPRGIVESVGSTVQDAPFLTLLAAFVHLYLLPIIVTPFAATPLIFSQVVLVTTKLSDDAAAAPAAAAVEVAAAASDTTNDD